MTEDISKANTAVPWSAAEIVRIFLVGILCQSVVYTLLDATGFYRWYYGGDGLKEVVQAGEAAGQLAQYRLGLWAGCVSTLMQVVAALSILRFSSGTTPGQIGLTTRNLGRNVAGGLLFALIFAPGAYALQQLALQFIRHLGGKEQPHPFAQLGKEGLYPAEWVLLFAAAVALAPLWEEIFYRGIVQPWVMAQQPMGGAVALAIAFAATLTMRAEHVRTAIPKGGGAMFLESLPFVTLLVLIGVYAVLHRRGRVAQAGLLATAVLFAWVHVRVWPSPVALVWLALGLGWLRWRGQSVLGCIVLHAVFNAIACVALVVSSWGK